MSSPEIRCAAPHEAPALARLIAESFAPLPVTEWLVEDETERVDALTGQFEIIVEHAIKYGDVYVVGDEDRPTGVAVWFPPHQIPDMDDYDERLAAAAGPHTPRFVELDAAMHDAHPDGPPHAYLVFMAVRATDRNHGIGAALLDAHHGKLDASGTPAYLEASGLRSRELYLRHRYVDQGSAYGPAGINEFRPMWRDAA
jgi:ribosomal protein S18 acetylase RimI-like enzyme